MDRFNKFVTILAKKLPGFNVKYKNESTLMKIIAFLLFFNRSFMDSFITTIGRTIYFPSKKFVEERPGSIKTLAHEYVHAKDASKITNILFGILYLFPQILGIIALLSWLVLGPLMLFGVVSWTLWLLIPLISLVFLAPIPSPFRMHYELRAYKMSLFASDELMKEAGFSYDERLKELNRLAEYQNNNFIGPNYYFMWPFGVKKQLAGAIEDILSGKIVQQDYVYLEISEVIKNSK